MAPARCLDSLDAVSRRRRTRRSRTTVERRKGADGDRRRSLPTQRAHSTTAGRRIRRTSQRATTRRRSSGRCTSEARGSWMRSTASRGGASSSCDGTMSPIWSARSKRRPDFPDEDSERSLWMGETGIRLVLQRLAPSRANLERLSELIAANERDERCELMWGSPGTILAGRELGLDVTASIEWLHGRRDTEGLWTQHLYGQTTRYLGPAHGFAGCVLALGDVAAVSETLQRFAVEEDGLVNWPPHSGEAARRERRRPDPHAVVPWRAGDRRDARSSHRRGACGRGRRVDVACRAAAQGREPLPRHRR